MKSLLALDPGLEGTGWALWPSEPRVHRAMRKFAPTAVGVITARKSEDEDWWQRAFEISDTVCALMPSRKTLVVAEFTEFHGSAFRQMGWKTGALQKLTFLSGVIARAVQPAPFQPITTSTWKGQMPKTVVQDRITSRFGLAECKRLGIKTHAWDAVGLGLYVLGEL